MGCDYYQIPLFQSLHVDHDLEMFVGFKLSLDSKQLTSLCLSRSHR